VIPLADNYSSSLASYTLVANVKGRHCAVLPDYLR
jgi:hypothetical protein